ncbi:MAG: hypothetical protein GY943_33500 [Chloroflexi bacterium]|nr:hypothetical protein [Chloroflexota bacterium]
MVSKETIWNEVWPTVEKLIQATVDEDSDTISQLVVPGGQAAEMLDLFGFAVFDVLLKTVLGRGSLGVTRVVETENGRFIHLEYAWPEPGNSDGSYTATDVVTVTFEQADGSWRAVEINPAALDLPITGPRARAVLKSTKELSDDDTVPSEPWILPIALYGGLLQIPIQSSAIADAVEGVFLPGLQKSTHGVMSLVNGRRLWRDFKAAANPSLDKPAGWAAAIEFLMNHQMGRNVTQAAVSKQYKVNLSIMVPRIKQIKKALKLKEEDERYADNQATQIVFSNQNE